VNLPAVSKVTIEEAFNNILKSINLEETALTSFINAEKEKMLAVSGHWKSQNNVDQLEKNITFVLQIVTEMQRILQLKRAKLLNIQDKNSKATEPSFTSSGLTMEHTYSLAGNGKGIITKKGDLFYNGSSNLQINFNDSHTFDGEDNCLNYKVQKLGNQLAFSIDPTSLSIHCPHRLQEIPTSQTPNILILTGKGEVTRNAPTRKDTTNFTLTVWDGGSGPPGTDKFHLIIRANNNPDLDHDSGIVYLSGNLTINHCQYQRFTQRRLLYGIVSSNGQAISKAVLKLLDLKGNTVKQVLTNRNGTYEIKNIEPQSYYLDVWAEGYLPPDPLKVELDTNPLTELNISIEKDLSLTGSILGLVEDTCTKEPLEGTIVNLYLVSPTEEESYLKTVLTDRDGHFCFKAAPGNYRLEVDYLDGSTQSLITEVKSAKQLANIYVKLSKNSKSVLQGRIKNHQGLSIPYVEVILYRKTDDKYLTAIAATRTDKTGNYLFTNLLPNNQYQIKIKDLC